MLILLNFLATEKFQDGFWGRWGAYDKCSGTCGWGVQTRRRKCDNPIPSYGGKECSGISVMKHLCRKTRCGGGTFFSDVNAGFVKQERRGIRINEKQQLVHCLHSRLNYLKAVWLCISR